MEDMADMDAMLRSHRDELMSFVDGWLRRFQDMEGQRFREPRVVPEVPGCGARHWQRPGVPKPREVDPPELRVEPREEVTSAEAEPIRIASKASRRADRMDSYALATYADKAVSEEFNRVASKSESGKSSRSMGFSPSFQKIRRMQKKLAHVMNSQLSTSFWTMLILTNSIYLGVHVEITAMNPEISQIPAFFYIHLAYAIIFTVEVLLRAFAAGSLCEYLWASKPWAWNWLDVFVVVSSWAEMVVGFANGDGRAANTNLRIMRIMRIGRLARVVRVVRVVRLFRALRTLVASLMGTLKSLFWSFLLLGLVIYIFGILFTDVLLDFREGQSASGTGDGSTAELDHMKRYFGNLGTSSATLFRAISDGISWQAAADSLKPAGVFCNSAIKAAENDTELLVQSTVQMRKELRAHVVNLFHDIDARGLGRVTITDFEKAFDTDTMQAPKAV
eukprot:Skav200383  [mRNA]  locus=scaffold2518:413221:416712:- [translate_table: standard]